MKKKSGPLTITAAVVAAALGSAACSRGNVKNQPEVVYGPPEMFETRAEETIPVEVYGPPQMFETTAEETVPVCVYGPPEMFESAVPEDSKDGSENK